MEDRSVQYPQRYQLKKVEGTDDIYDLISAPGEITAEGTLINKSALLKDETAALFKDLPEDPVPDDVLKVLSKAALFNGEYYVLPNGEKTYNLKVETGGYIGTGQYGAGTSVSISSNFGVPRIAIISYSESGAPDNGQLAVFINATGNDKMGIFSCVPTSNDVTFGINDHVSVEGNTMSWFGYSAKEQLNLSGKQYYYAIITA